MPRKLFICFGVRIISSDHSGHRADLPRCRRAFTFMQNVANLLHLSVEKEIFFLFKLQVALLQYLERFAHEFIMFHYGLRIEEFPFATTNGSRAY